MCEPMYVAPKWGRALPHAQGVILSLVGVPQIPGANFITSKAGSNMATIHLNLKQNATSNQVWIAKTVCAALVIKYRHLTVAIFIHSLTTHLCPLVLHTFGSNHLTVFENSNMLLKNQVVTYSFDFQKYSRSESAWHVLKLFLRAHTCKPYAIS